MKPLLALRVATCLSVLAVASTVSSQARPIRADALTSPALRAVRAAIRRPLGALAAAAPGVRRGDGRAYAVRAYRLARGASEQDGWIAVGRAYGRPDPDDDVWYETLLALPRPLQPDDALWEDLEIEHGERSSLAALESALGAAVASRSELALFALRCGWADAPGAAYRGVLVVDRSTREALWVFGERRWSGE